MNKVELLGFIAGSCFMLSAIPLAWKCVKIKRADPPWVTIALLVSGSLMMMSYGALISAIPLVVDMTVTFSCWLTIGIVKFIYPQKS